MTFLIRARPFAFVRAAHLHDNLARAVRGGLIGRAANICFATISR